MFDILGLTNSDTVRATIGVDDNDLNDSGMLSFDIESNLIIDLLDWFPNWADLVADVGGDPVVQNQLTALKVYAKYFCAFEILLSGQMAFLQRRTDGENQAHRFKEDSLADLREAFLSRMDKAKAQVLEIETAYTPAGDNERTHTLFSRQAPAKDQVTE